MAKVRTNVTLPADLLEEIDRIAGSGQRSGFLAEAAREKLARIRFDRAASRAFGCWKDADHPDLATQADVERYLKRARAHTNRRLQDRRQHE